MTQNRKLRNTILVTVLTSFIIGGFYTVAFGSVVLNGSSSLPHNAYFMVRWPKLIVSGSYVAFDAPDVVAQRFQAFSFVKRIVGTPGDVVEVEGARVCVKGECRELQPHLVERGIAPIAPMTLGAGQYLVFGDSEDSLDSRYALIGVIEKSNIEAVGFPMPFPHWKEIHAWFE